MKLRRPSGFWIASVAVHAVVFALFVEALIVRHSVFNWFGDHRNEMPMVEHIGFLSLPSQKTPGPTVAGRRGGDGHAVAKPPIRLVAPAAVPTKIPVTSRSTQETADLGPSTGPLIGGGGPLRGIQPRYTGPRLWGTESPSQMASAPKTSAERLDSVITSDITAHNDSIAIASGNRRAPGDWTFEKNGQKYGIDSKYIRLGPVSIPTAVLAMLPINVTGNPTTYEHEHTVNARHDEIFYQAHRAMDDADFQKAVREIRQRKDRERKEAEAAKQKAASEAAPGSGPQ